MNRLGIYAPSGRFGQVKNPFGKDTANLALFRALASQANFDDVTFLTHDVVSADAITRELFGERQVKSRIRTGSPLRHEVLTNSSTVLRGTPDLADLAWRRALKDDRAYSLVGLIHTLGPPAVREKISQLAVAPIQPWDALVCTSPAVVSATRTLFEGYGDYLAKRFRGTERPHPRLPLIPLGVDSAHLKRVAGRADVRVATRASFDIGDEDCIVFWLGRLSFFEKAFPQAMFRALEEANRTTKEKIHFVMAGWFPRGAADLQLYKEAANACCPSVPVHFIDGNDRDAIDAQWASADLFLSVVDNIQETFGLAPIEAMAAGLPVVASDWDGYRYTIRDGVDGFLAPTLGGPKGAADLISARHILGIDSYQTYVGTVAQFTAVDISSIARSLSLLVENKDLRKRMGEAAQSRAENVFDWRHVAAQYHDLAADLSGHRAHAERFGSSVGQEVATHPIKGDPFTDFAIFATKTIDRATRLTSLVDRDCVDSRLKQSQSIALDMFGSAWRLDLQDCRRILDALCERAATLDELSSAVAAIKSIDALSLSIVWMCKMGLISWEN